MPFRFPPDTEPGLHFAKTVVKSESQKRFELIGLSLPRAMGCIVAGGIHVSEPQISYRYAAIEARLCLLPLQRHR